MAKTKRNGNGVNEPGRRGRDLRALYPQVWRMLLAASNAEDEGGAEAAIPHLRKLGRSLLAVTGPGR